MLITGTTPGVEKYHSFFPNPSLARFKELVLNLLASPNETSNASDTLTTQGYTITKGALDTSIDGVYVRTLDFVNSVLVASPLEEMVLNPPPLVDFGTRKIMEVHRMAQRNQDAKLITEINVRISGITRELQCGNVTNALSLYEALITNPNVNRLRAAWDICKGGIALENADRFIKVHEFIQAVPELRNGIYIHKLLLEALLSTSDFLGKREVADEIIRSLPDTPETAESLMWGHTPSTDDEFKVMSEIVKHLPPQDRVNLIQVNKHFQKMVISIVVQEKLIEMRVLRDVLKSNSIDVSFATGFDLQLQASDNLNRINNLIFSLKDNLINQSSSGKAFIFTSEEYEIDKTFLPALSVYSEWSSRVTRGHLYFRLIKNNIVLSPLTLAESLKHASNFRQRHLEAFHFLFHRVFAENHLSLSNSIMVVKILAETVVNDHEMILLKKKYIREMTEQVFTAALELKYWAKALQVARGASNEVAKYKNTLSTTKIELLMKFYVSDHGMKPLNSEIKREILFHIYKMPNFIGVLELLMEHSFHEEALTFYENQARFDDRGNFPELFHHLLYGEASDEAKPVHKEYEARICKAIYRCFNEAFTADDRIYRILQQILDIPLYIRNKNLEKKIYRYPVLLLKLLKEEILALDVFESFARLLPKIDEAIREREVLIEDQPT